MIPTQETDHAGQAVALLTDAYRGKPNITGVLRAAVKPLQELEAVIWDVILKRLLDNANDAQLDALGKIVGESRDGRDNETYRTAIRLRVRVNRSRGRAEDIIDVVRLALSPAPFTYSEAYPAGFIVEAETVPALSTLLRLLAQAKAAGVYGVLHAAPWPAGETFKWGSTTGPVSGANGFGDVVGGSINAKWASAHGVKK